MQEAAVQQEGLRYPDPKPDSVRRLPCPEQRPRAEPAMLGLYAADPSSEMQGCESVSLGPGDHSIR